MEGVPWVKCIIPSFEAVQNSAVTPIPAS